MLPVKAPDEGQIGGPVPGLSRWQLAKFREGKALFHKQMRVADGLGPYYNGNSCAACHSLPEAASADLNLKSQSQYESVDSYSSAQLGQLNASVKTKTASMEKSNSKSKGKAEIVESKASKSTENPQKKSAGKEEEAKPADVKKVLAESDILLFAKRLEKGRFQEEKLNSILSKTELSDLDLMLKEGGPVLLRKAINLDADKLNAACKLTAVPKAPASAEFQSQRVSRPLMGLGFVETIPDPVINFSAARQGLNKNAVHGRAVQVPQLYWPNPRFGRYGAKAQFSTLLSLLANELAVNEGISNPLFNHSLFPEGMDKSPECLRGRLPADPNDDGTALLKINFYLMTVAPPRPGASTGETVRGNSVFTKLGCAACHTQSMMTPGKVLVFNPDANAKEIFAGIKESSPPIAGFQGRYAIFSDPKFVEMRALENKSFSPYSDFLLHDLGPALADGLAQQFASGAEWKTSPLWGLRYRKRYMHDGRAKTLPEAISLHGGQAEESAKAFLKLSEKEKNDLIAFLNSL